MSVQSERLEWILELRVLVLLVSIAILGDIVTTMYGLSIGLPEGNPFVKAIVENHGILGMLGLKTFAIAWCVFIYYTMGERYGKAALLGILIPQGLAVVLNILTIAQA